MKYNQEHVELADTIRCTPGQAPGYRLTRETAAQMIADAIYQELRPVVRERNKLRKALREHTELAKKVISAIDAEMKKPSDTERGKRIGKIIYALEFNNDSVRHFELGEEFPLSR